jgi:hypothetical protein
VVTGGGAKVVVTGGRTVATVILVEVDVDEVVTQPKPMALQHQDFFA